LGSAQSRFAEALFGSLGGTGLRRQAILLQNAGRI